VDHGLLCDPFIVRTLDAIRRGEIGDVVSVDYFRSQSYPPYAGGVLPPSTSKALSVSGHGDPRTLFNGGNLGDILDVTTQFTGGNGDSNLRYSEWRTLVRCRRGLGQFQLSWNVKPHRMSCSSKAPRILRADYVPA
jgi:hypothetical protein